MADSPRIEELKRRVQMDPASIAFAALAEEYRRTGRYEDAIEVCRTGLQRHPSYISAHVTLGRALMEVGRYDEARQELEYVLSVAPENLAAIRGLAEIHHRQGQSSEHADYTASEMADMLAPRRPLPVPVAASEAPGKAETSEKSETTETAGTTEKTVAIEKTEAVEEIEVVEEYPEIEVASMADVGTIDLVATATIDLQPSVETPAPVPAKPVVAPPPAVRAAAAVPEPPKVGPALERLEAFLQAILRARETAGSTLLA